MTLPLQKPKRLDREIGAKSLGDVCVKIVTFSARRKIVDVNET